MFALASIPIRIGYYGPWQRSPLFIAIILLPRSAVYAGRYEPDALGESIEEEDRELYRELYAKCVTGGGGG